MLLDAAEKACKEEAEHKACVHEINSFRDNLGGARGPLRVGPERPLLDYIKQETIK